MEKPRKLSKTQRERRDRKILLRVKVPGAIYKTIAAQAGVSRAWVSLLARQHGIIRRRRDGYKRKNMVRCEVKVPPVFHDALKRATEHLTTADQQVTIQDLFLKWATQGLRRQAQNNQGLKKALGDGTMKQIEAQVDPSGRIVIV